MELTIARLAHELGIIERNETHRRRHQRHGGGKVCAVCCAKMSLYSFLSVCLVAQLSVCYCYTVPKFRMARYDYVLRTGCALNCRITRKRIILYEKLGRQFRTTFFCMWPRFRDNGVWKLARRTCCSIGTGYVCSWLTISTCRCTSGCVSNFRSRLSRKWGLLEDNFILFSIGFFS